MEKTYLYIVLTRTNTVISRLIHFFTQDDYTHAALALDKDLAKMYSFGRKNTYNPFVGRFKQEKLTEGIYKLSRELPGVILEIGITQEQYEAVNRLLEEFIANKSLYKYNYKGLVYGLLNKPMTNETRFLCSQFVYYVLHKNDIVDFGVPSNLVRPQDFLDLKARIVFRGDLKSLVDTEAAQSIPLRVLNWYREKLPFSRAG